MATPLKTVPEVQIYSAPHGSDPFWRARHRIMTEVKAKAKTKQEACEAVMERVSSCNLQPEHHIVDGFALRRGWK